MANRAFGTLRKDEGWLLGEICTVKREREDGAFRGVVVVTL